MWSLIGVWSLAAQKYMMPHSAIPMTILLAATDAYYEEDNEEEKDQFILRPDQIGRYDLKERSFQTIAPLKEPAGLMMPYWSRMSLVFMSILG